MNSRVSRLTRSNVSVPDQNSLMKRVHVTISGRVQGVCFRLETQREAQRLGVRGWVRNLADGRVEGTFEGLPEQVDALVEWCHDGPSLARVGAVEVRTEAVGGDFESFLIRH